MASEKRLVDANVLEEMAKISDKPAWMIVRDAPTVDAVEVVHGEWDTQRELKRYRGANIPVIQCSECKCYFCDIINNHHYMYHYCPNCGIKMDRERTADHGKG